MISRDNPLRKVIDCRIYPAPRTRDGRKIRLHLECGHMVFRNGGAGIPKKARCYWCGLPAGSDIPRDICWRNLNSSTGQPALSGK